MHINYHFLYHLSITLNKLLIGKKITACFSQEKDELVILFNESEFVIKSHVTPQFSCLYFPLEFKRAKQNSIDIWPEIRNLSVTKIYCFENERALALELNENYTLVFKFFGNRPNILLFSGENILKIFNNALVSDQNISLPNLHRKHLPAFDDFNKGINQKQIFFTWGKIIHGTVNLFFEKNILTNIEKWDYLTALNNKLSQPLFYIGYYKGIPTLSLIELENVKKITIDPIEAANIFYLFFQQEFYFSNEKNKIETQLNKDLQKIENYLEDVSQKLKTLKTQKSNLEIANIIMANLHTIEEETELVELYDFYTDSLVKIKLKKDLSAQKNAENYYRKSKNEKIEWQNLENNIIRQTQKRAEILQKLEQLKEATNSSELKKFIKVNKSVSTYPTKKELFKQYFLDGFEILVGKNAKNNDLLTLKFAHKEDYWFHARDCSGSHVILKKEATQSVPNHVIEFAAGLAAYNSKRKNEKLVPVIFTTKKYVRKTKNLKEGQVVIDKESTIVIEPIKN
jgi:predicted ribosome quality control (RQC) complex YloA/Tae2 family protein